MHRPPVVVDRPLLSEKSQPEIVAGVDLGSNSFHMIIAELCHGELAVVDRVRETVRLAEGLSPNNDLSSDARQRSLDCLARFGQRLRELGVGRVRAAGTSTMRRVRNDVDFLSAAEDMLGHPIEVISGLEEARLVYAGVAASVPPTDALRLVTDIGGGSTEIILGKADLPREMKSLQLGCVSMTERFFPGGTISHAGFSGARQAARLELARVRKRFCGVTGAAVIGASGTVRATLAVAKHLALADTTITPKTIESLIDTVLRVNSVADLSLKGLSQRRAQVWPGGLAILAELLESLQIAEMNVSDGALREGLLNDLRVASFTKA